MPISDVEYRDLLNTHAKGLATRAELRGEISGIVASQRHDPREQKLVAEISEETGDPADEIMDRILGRVRAKLLPTASTSTTTPHASNAAVAAYRALLEK